MSSMDDFPNDRLRSRNLRGINEALDALKESQPGTHCLVVYPDLASLRAIYSQYLKILLEERNEVVLFLPYYETLDMVRLVLSGRNEYDDDNTNNNNSSNGRLNFAKNSGINVEKYEKEGSLVIVDSVKGLYDFDSESDKGNANKNQMDLTAFLSVLEKHAKRRQKDGIAVMADMGSFYHSQVYDHHIKRLMKYEMSLPERYSGKEVKRFCLYHQRDFEERFKQEEQAELLDYHNRNIMFIDAR